MRFPLLTNGAGFLVLTVGSGWFAGCAGVSDSFRLEKTVLVKVPVAKPVSQCTSEGWEFRHVLEAPRDRERAGQWYVAWNNSKPIATGRFTSYWHTLFERAPEIAAAAKAGFGEYPLLIEPNRTFKRVASKQPAEPRPGERVTAEYGEGVRLVIKQPLMKVWPDGRKRDPEHPGRFVVDPMWYMDDEHSEMASARGRFRQPGKGIVIGHLDNGLDARHPASPQDLERGDWRANVVGLLNYAQRKSRGERLGTPIPPELTGGSHGLGTSGILAGSWVAIDEKPVRGGRIQGYYGWLGGAPYSHVVPVRVAPWVFSLSTGELAYAIDYASRVKRCDVITMSHGGAPTQAWVDAVNAAYERGTAMFAAESDFFSIVADPLQPRGIVLPASPVYPAAFRRVVGVTGVTAEHRSYARNSLGRLLGDPGGFLKWTARGSYGADGTSTAVLRSTDEADHSQLGRSGQLRPQPIAAYSPNIPWISVREVNGRRIADGVDLDGAGTSAATPQVAAAAALWLQMHRAELERAGYWSDWHKAEAVYHALLKSADRQGKLTPDKYLGAGLLRANAALDISLEEIVRAKPPREPRPRDGRFHPPPDGSLYFTKAPNDYFDGVRSVWGLFGLQSLRHVPISMRAVLRQNNTPARTPEQAMQRMFYNMLLLREWHGGDTPRKDVAGKRGQETMYWNRAGRMAAKVAAFR